MKNVESNGLSDFLQNQKEAETYLSQYGESGKDKNIGVSLSYENIAKKDPLFVWFSAATMGSIQVGDVISLANKPILKDCESTKIVSEGFSYGNQTIHNNVIALYNTYQDKGIDGLKNLLALDYERAYISAEAIKAFERFSYLESKAGEYANKVDLSPTDPRVLKHILSNHENMGHAS